MSTGSAPAGVSGLEDHLGYWLRFVSNHVSHAFARKVEARGVTVSEWVLLRQMVAQPQAAAGALAQGIGMSKGAISKLVDRLEAKGLLTRAAVAGDRRAQQLALTRAGRALVPALARLADANDAEFFGHLAPRRRDELARAMQEIVRIHQLKAVPVD
jgi:DNA-binding MarR family transcriptional regulator